MIHHDVEQGSGDWMRLRMGIPTASEFHKIITPKTRELSKQAKGYAYWLAAERLLGRPLESLVSTEWMERGRELEPAAVRLYEFEREITTLRCGFLTTDDGRIGASPDRLIEGHAAAVEIKCPSPQVHLLYMREGFGEEYITQAQGQILVGELDWCDRYAYHPDMPPAATRTYRDEAFLTALRAALDQFCDLVDEIERWGRSTGFFAERFETAVERGAGRCRWPAAYAARCGIRVHDRPRITDRLRQTRDRATRARLPAFRRLGPHETGRGRSRIRGDEGCSCDAGKYRGAAIMDDFDDRVKALAQRLMGELLPELAREWDPDKISVTLNALACVTAFVMSSLDSDAMPFFQNVVQRLLANEFKNSGPRS